LTPIAHYLIVDWEEREITNYRRMGARRKLGAGAARLERCSI
jgi:hypothetical protein